VYEEVKSTYTKGPFYCVYTANEESHKFPYCTQRQKSSEVGLTCQLALKSGTLTPKGVYTPTAAESTDKLPRFSEEKLTEDYGFHGREVDE
jgi:hypothetical protein